LSLSLPVAHALVGRQDLPIPAWLFAWGASVVLILSFVALSVLWRTPRLEREGWRPLTGPISRATTSRVAEIAAGTVGVFLLGVVIWAGLAGTESATQNFSLTFVFVTFWLGGVLLSVLFGDVMRAFNPWRALARAAGAAYRRLTGRAGPPPLPYPEGLGRWPAVAGIVLFVWLELVYGAASGLEGEGLTPQITALATLLYSALTFLAMSAWGIERWIDRGEAFSNYFRMFSLLAPLEVREGKLGRRKLLSGFGTWAAVPGSVALVTVSIGVTSFDGAQEGLFGDAINSTFNFLLDRGLALDAAFRLADSLFLAGMLLGVAAVYWIGVRGMVTVGEGHSVRELGTRFAHTLIPIALAYLVAHYFSLFLFQEQAQFTYLLSDPLGKGWDLFGTASGGIDYSLIGATAVWYVQVAALVIGHVTALTLAHDRALVVYRDSRRASRSQYWMLAVMIFFTCFGLYILSQANQ
jgi:hypothetical protein